MGTVFSHTSDVLSDSDGPIPLRFLLTSRSIVSPVSAISARVLLNSGRILCWATNKDRNDSPDCEQK